NYFAYIKGQATPTGIGGGMFGGILFAFSYYLFSSTGAKIVAVFMILIGIIFTTEISIGDFFTKIGKRMKNIFSKSKDRLGEYKQQKQDMKNIEKEAGIEEETIEEPIIEDFTDISYAFPEEKEKTEIVDSQDEQTKDHK